MIKKPDCEELELRYRELEQEAARRESAEEALRKEEERLSQIVEGSPIPTFVIDNNHIITNCNRAWENLTGLSANEIIGTSKQWLFFYTTERPVLADFIVDNASEEDIDRYYHGKYRKSAVIDGGYEVVNFFPNIGEKGKWLSFTAAPLKDSEGNITGAVETLQDITERIRADKKRRESERRLQVLLDFVPYPIVVFTLEGGVYYLNPAFTNTFGWTFEELEGKTIPYTPPGMEQETREMLKRLFEEKIVLRHETRRLTKDGRTLDVVMRAAIYSDAEGKPIGELVTLRDITREKRITRNNEAILRISTALPEYPDLGDLLDYISSEVKRLLDSEGSLVILLDEEARELFFSGASYDDFATQERIKDIRFPVDELVAGKVIKTGEPIIVSDTSKDPLLHLERDKRLGYHTKNLLLVPMKSSDRIIGVISAINKKNEAFNKADTELLSMIAGTVALSIENARFSEELKKAYREVTSLNRAKDKVINHLSHELKTPVSVLSGSLNILERKLSSLPDETWKRTAERIKRNLERIVEIQEEVDDIMKEKGYKTRNLMSMMLDQCADELETLIGEEVGDGPVIERVRRRIDEIFAPGELFPGRILLHEYAGERLESLRPLFAHRGVEVTGRFDPAPAIYIPAEPLQKVIDGLIKNAVENTPDQGKIDVIVKRDGEGIEMVVRDYGVGITKDNQVRIFEGFFATQDTMAYSSKRPFDFNAGGKGADLLRMKIFSERYNFRINMVSMRCQFIPRESDVCPGEIGKCTFCAKIEDCHHSGGTTFSLNFPPARISGNES